MRCFLFIVYFRLLFVASCFLMLIVGHCWLSVVRWLFDVVCCSLFVVCCLLCGGC